MEPVSTIAGAWSIAKAAGEASKKLHDLAKNLKDRDLKAEIHQVVDQLHELKQAASELEDQNRALREQLRFKSEEYEFRTPFYYEKAHPERALCPKCFAKNIPAPMAPLIAGEDYRLCLVCNQSVDVVHAGGRYPLLTRDDDSY
jgi:hypothetical protein